jgi:hypothetical protein
MSKLITIGIIVLVTLAVMSAIGQHSGALRESLPAPQEGRLDLYPLAAVIMIAITAGAIGRLLRRR